MSDNNLVVLKFNDENIEIWLRNVLYTRKKDIDEANSIVVALKYKNLKIAS